ncbi:putative ribonuclease p complex subunit pop1 protein [Neofusicoccum parvum UCRNP2]|uniref:Putative ribonuclease p complex subunit pop1 protein n=1 Tax=Botryosphaeria parva (strain UCR-NP2) TaxID=1287680 RepID=R1H1K2_BOTPV|nr:putative ribonuclease p complex subunit pop1 protein [Neofusicoccum parvum UCRNP2]
MAEKGKQPASKQQQNQNRKRAKSRDARAIAAQSTGTAFKNGEVNVDAFVTAREYEIKALEDGMNKARKGLTTRAFQGVPRELRRRTASHNVKRVPQRLRKRAAREMAEDNTPTVTARRRRPNAHMRLRLETAEKLKKVTAKAKARKAKKEGKANGDSKADGDMKVTVTPAEGDAVQSDAIKTRKPRVKTSKLKNPPTPPVKFQEHIQKLLRDFGVDHWGKKGQKWRDGTRTWEGWLFEKDGWPEKAIAPVTIIWCAEPKTEDVEMKDDATESASTKKKHKRKVLIRIHPSAFKEFWDAIHKHKPPVTVEDLRWEIGSIEITGPGATEALRGVLDPVIQGFANPLGERPRKLASG